MKRIIPLLLVLTMTLTLAACGVDKSELKSITSVTTAGDHADDAAPENVPDEAPDDAEDETSADTTEPDAPATSSKDVTIEETVLLDEAGVKITAKSLEPNTLFGPEVKLLIENDSGVDLTVQARDSSVNGYMVDAIFSCDIVSGKKANDELTFLSSDLEACGIETIADIELSFHLYRSDNWDTYLDSAPVSLTTSAADTYAYDFDDAGELLYDDGSVRIVARGLSEDDSIFGPGVVLYVENNGTQDVTIQTRDVSVNGFMISAVFSCDVCAGKHAVDAITFFSSELEESGIETITDIELSFHLFDSDSWSTIADSDPIALTF